MKPVDHLAFLACVLLGMAMPARAQDGVTLSATGQAFRVDDAGTVVLDPVLELEWQPGGQSGDNSSLVSGSTRVSVQLNVAAWAGQTGRIYMTLPRTSGPSIRATWSTGGVLAPGSLISGDRAVVYTGPMNGSFLRDLITIKLEADGARLVQPEALAFGFEMEVVK